MALAVLDSTYDGLAWGSHLPALMAALGAMDGPVIEVGVGHLSTLVPNAFCRSAGRFLASIEDDPEWNELFSKRYASVSHGFYHGKYDEIVPTRGQTPGHGLRNAS